MKCYKLVFNITSLTKNFGSISIIIIFFIYLSCLITYIIKKIEPLTNELQKGILKKEEKIIKNTEIIVNKKNNKEDKYFNKKAISSFKNQKKKKKKILKKD